MKVINKKVIDKSVAREYAIGLLDLSLPDDRGEERCYGCGEKQGVSPKGYFMCTAPTWPCSEQCQMYKTCSRCDEMYHIEYNHYYCDVCASCYDEDDPCPFH